MALTQFAHKFTNDFTATPADGAFDVPPRCPTAIEYQPGAQPLAYWDYTEAWIGPPSATHIWESGLDAPIAKIMRQAYRTAKEPVDYDDPTTSTGTQSRGYLWRFDGEKAEWVADTGYADPPGQAGFIGTISNQFAWRWTNLGFHLNDHENAAGVYTDPWAFLEAGAGSIKMGDADYYNNPDYRY